MLLVIKNNLQIRQGICLEMKTKMINFCSGIAMNNEIQLFGATNARGENGPNASILKIC